MTEWIDELAEAFELRGLSDDETGRILVVARDVAHRVERKDTPLAAFLMGMDVAGRITGGVPRDAAINESIAAVEALLPEAPDPRASP
jgi:Domain of unknown function (DUF6457)